MQRYINDSAHLQVNISSINRYTNLQQQMDLFNNNDKYIQFGQDLLSGKNDQMLNQLYTMFDDSCVCKNGSFSDV